MREHLENKNPTNVEKHLYKYAGLYLIESNEDCLKYAPIHIGDTNTFPNVINDIEEDLIEYDSMIIFDKLSETVSLNGFYDIDMICLIRQRMEELHFNMIL